MEGSLLEQDTNTDRRRLPLYHRDLNYIKWYMGKEEGNTSVLGPCFEHGELSDNGILVVFFHATFVDSCTLLSPTSTSGGFFSPQRT